MEWLYCYLHEAESAQEINWKEEAESAEEVGFSCHSFDYEMLLAGRVEEALADLPEGQGRKLVYRGWLMETADYQELEDACHARGYHLVASRYEYEAALALPTYFEQIQDLTPPALWTEDPDIDEAWELARSLGEGPWIVKDHIKSAKEHWLEACYVPAGATFEQFRSVCEELRDHRGALFAGGYLVRPFIDLKKLGVHWTGLPIFEEYRLIFWQGKLLLADSYNDIGEVEADFSPFEHLGDLIDSPFFVADVARTEAGDLTLLELNPGGCAGLPPLLHSIDFYSRIAEDVGLLEVE